VAFASGLEAWAELDLVVDRGAPALPETIKPFLLQCRERDERVSVARLEPPGRPLPAAQVASPWSPSLVTLRLSDSEPNPDAEVLAVIDRARPVVLATAINSGPSGRWRRQLAATALVALAATGTFGAAWAVAAPDDTSRMGTLALRSDPPGAQAFIDGTPRGLTPLTLQLAEGEYLVELRGRGEPRTLPVAIQAGVQVSQSVELPEPVSSWGRIEVRTDPPGQHVTIDGVPLGPSPMRVDLAAGKHSVVLGEGADGEGLEHQVTIEPATTTSLVLPGRPDAPDFGWLTVVAPVDVQVYEDGQLLGSSQSPRIMLAAGRHDLEVVNHALGYREAWTAEIGPGETTQVDVTFPTGSLILRATPGAEVWVDGRRAGKTPMDALAVPLGPHEVIFRHPELGERRYAITVTQAEPARLSVDLTR
jgi:hypothetical protein